MSRDARGTAGWDAIVLAGGRAERLGGASKPDVIVGHQSLLDRTVAAVQGASRIVVAGNVHADGCTTAVEPEPFGGPVSGIAAALPHTSQDWVLVVACDHPFVDHAVPELVHAQTSVDGVVAVDRSGRRQNLLVLLRRDALVDALTQLGDPYGRSMRQLLALLDLDEVPIDDLAALDVDTWDDIERTRALAERKELRHG